MAHSYLIYKFYFSTKLSLETESMYSVKVLPHQSASLTTSKTYVVLDENPVANGSQVTYELPNKCKGPMYRSFSNCIGSVQQFRCLLRSVPPQSDTNLVLTDLLQELSPLNLSDELQKQQANESEYSKRLIGSGKLLSLRCYDHRKTIDCSSWWHVGQK